MISHPNTILSHLSTRESEEEATPSQLTRQEDPSRHLRVSQKLISRALRQPCMGRNQFSLAYGQMSAGNYRLLATVLVCAAATGRESLSLPKRSSQHLVTRSCQSILLVKNKCPPLSKEWACRVSHTATSLFLGLG